MAELGKLCLQFPRVLLRGDDGCSAAGGPPHTSLRAPALQAPAPHLTPELPPTSSADPIAQCQSLSAVIQNHHIPRNQQPIPKRGFAQPLPLGNVDCKCQAQAGQISCRSAWSTAGIAHTSASG